MRFVLKSCRVRIRSVVGTRANGAPSTRTFAIRHMKENLSPEQAATVVRAITALLDRDIASAQLVREYEIAGDDPEEADPTPSDATTRADAPTISPQVIDLADLLSREPLYVSELLSHMTRSEDNVDTS